MSCVYCYCVRFHGPGICHVCIATVLDSMDQVYVCIATVLDSMDQVYVMCVLLLC